MKKKMVLCTITALALACIFGGCGKQKEETPAELENAENVSGDEYTYVAAYHPVGGAGKQVGPAVIGNDQNIFYLEYENSKILFP